MEFQLGIWGYIQGDIQISGTAIAGSIIGIIYPESTVSSPVVMFSPL